MKLCTRSVSALPMVTVTLTADEAVVLAKALEGCPPGVRYRLGDISPETFRALFLDLNDAVDALGARHRMGHPNPRKATP